MCGLWSSQPSGLSFVVELPLYLAEATAGAQGDGLPLMWSEAVNFIVREWLTANAYLELLPAKEDWN